MVGRRRAIIIAGAVLAAALGLGVTRYVTFDPVAWADAVNDELSPAAVMARRASSAASAKTATSPPGASGGSDADLEAWRARARERSKAMRARFHPGSGDCVRYGGAEEPPPAVVDETAEAIVGAGLAPHLGELLADAVRWRAEADERAHAADAATEVLTYFGEHAGPWQRVGIWMHRNAALAALRKHVVAPPSDSSVHVAPESTARAREVTERYGRAILPAAMKITAVVRTVDLRAPQIAYLSPGMPESELERRIGTPAERTNDTWAWVDPALEVLVDERHEVIAISRGVQPGRDHVVVGDTALPGGDEPTLVKVLGAPAWAHDDHALREVVWEAGPLRRRLLLEDGKLSRVELWKKERLAPPK